MRKSRPIGFSPGEAKGKLRRLLPFNQQLNCANVRADSIRPYKLERIFRYYHSTDDIPSALRHGRRKIEFSKHCEMPCIFSKTAI